MINHEHKFIFVHINKNGGSSIEYVLHSLGKHHRISEYKKIANAQYGFKNYFKFTFARNPWGRFLSLYKYRVKTNQTNLRSQTIPFKDWARKIHDKDAFYYNNAVYLDAQLNWITDESEEVAVDFIGRFENLQEDFYIVCDKIGIPRQQLPHKNKSKHKHYTEYYDDETKQIVAEKYAKDIDYFGYEFGE